MIVSRIDGGLGNQMFQYAFGLQLARQHACPFMLDLSSYANKPAHGYLLDRFRIDARPLAATEQSRIPRRYTTQPGSWLADWFTPRRLKRVKEKPFGYSQRYLRAPADSYLVGYWQSELFFPDVRTLVREQFQLSEAPTSQCSRAIERLRSTASLAVHVRRGDYVTSRSAAAIYLNLSPDYYRRAVMTRLTERSGVEVTIFSNDIAWCQANLRFPCPVHFVLDSGGPHEELCMMAAAEGLVMANSTFSWWGAWLSERREPRVFAPRNWFHPGTLSDRHLPCPGWSLIDSYPPGMATATPPAVAA